LQRTFVGAFQIAEAVTLETLQQQGSVQAYLLPPEVAIADLPSVTLNDVQCQRVRNGQAIRLGGIDGRRVRVHTPDGTLLALLHSCNGAWQPEKVLSVG
jgi:tRNA U55 pseudouridine synthase TruB